MSTTTVKTVAVYSYQKYDKLLVDKLTELLGSKPENVRVIPVGLDTLTAELAHGCEAVCVFVNDKADAECLEVLGKLGIKLILTRSAGFNHIDLYCAEKLGMVVMRVPQYSPEAVAEHAVALLLALIRKLPKAYNRVREHNFNLSGLEGFTIHGKTIGVLGTGKIGQITAKILKGFGPKRLLGFDVFQSDAMKELGMEYLSAEEVMAQSDIITMHLPLLPNTYHVINQDTIAKMKKGVVIINTSRGGLIDTDALRGALKSGQIGAVGLDVYENEASFFFADCSDQIITDDTLSGLLTFPNVIITAHQAFLTIEALTTIADTTVDNIKTFHAGTWAESHNHCKAPVELLTTQPAQPAALERGPSGLKTE